MPISTARSATAGVRETGLQTFSAVSDPRLTWQHVTCDRASCVDFERGWTVRIDETMRIGKLCADYIRHVTRRPWTSTKDPSGVTIFTFPAGTPCFRDRRDGRAQRLFDVTPHKIRRVGAPTLYVVGAGNAGRAQAEINQYGRPKEIVRLHTRGADWVEHLAESWNRMADAINK